ncbi:hypothetical protein O3P69_015430 [Scylla paramamosain]|uniref:Uncharacterized protein n=1 Tax=Scylla paramamosain TaxID=85552 RepID=A0AAW0T8B4_SCYPA
MDAECRCAMTLRCGSYLMEQLRKAYRGNSASQQWMWMITWLVWILLEGQLVLMCKMCKNMLGYLCSGLGSRVCDGKEVVVDWDSWRVMERKLWTGVPGSCCTATAFLLNILSCCLTLN